MISEKAQVIYFYQNRQQGRCGEITDDEEARAQKKTAAEAAVGVETTQGAWCSGGSEFDALDAADDEEIGEGCDQRIDADEHQRAVERAGCRQDVADHDRSGNAGD